MTPAPPQLVTTDAVAELGLRGVVGMVAPVGAKQAETVVPLRRAKGEG